MAELVDAVHSKCVGLCRAGSIPALPTISSNLAVHPRGFTSPRFAVCRVRGFLANRR